MSFSKVARVMYFQEATSSVLMVAARYDIIEVDGKFVKIAER